MLPHLIFVRRRRRAAAIVSPPLARTKIGIDISPYVEIVESRILLTAVLTAGSHELLANTANQFIDIAVAGDSDVTGLNVRAQLGDGAGAAEEPVFDGVSFDEGIWTAAKTVTGGAVDGAAQFVQASVVFNTKGDSVASNGLAVRLSIDTTGFFSGTFDLKLGMTQIGADSVFLAAGGAEETVTITNGAITIVAVDDTGPTVTVDIVESSLNVDGNTSLVTFEFDENVSDFDKNDVTVVGGDLSNFVTVDANSFAATFTADDELEGTGTISVGTDYRDAAGNAGRAASSSVAIDTLTPTVAITPDGTTTTDSPIVFTFQFSETVTGFASSDVSIANGSAGTFTPLGSDTFTLAVTPAAPGTVTVSVATDAVQDLAGNGNLPNSASVTSSAPGTVTLPGGGIYEALLEGGDLVLRVSGGVEQFRRSVIAVSVLEITGSTGADVLTVLNSGGAVATPILFIGGGGNDLFDASLATGSTTLLGGAGNDTLTGGTGDDFIIGGSGKDILSGGAGADQLYGRSGPDTLTGGEGNDTIGGGSGSDRIEGGQGADFLTGGGGFDTISGGDGSDRIFGGPGKDLLDGDDGDDTLFGGGGADDIAGGLGTDTLNGFFRNDAFNQLVARDILIGGERPSEHSSPIILMELESKPESPQFHSPPTMTNHEASDTQQGAEGFAAEARTSIDESFANSLMPELLGL
ncbi:MAG: hypothetical protein HQ518_01660 [Rhodopirellula sp.]|nr:hypothetical protein [Rhodopirellula sp.]